MLVRTKCITETDENTESPSQLIKHCFWKTGRFEFYKRRTRKDLQTTGAKIMSV